MLTRQQFNFIVPLGFLALVAGRVLYYENVSKPIDQAEKILELLKSGRYGRSVSYPIDDKFSDESSALGNRHILYVPRSIDGIIINLGESPENDESLLGREEIDKKVLEAKLGYHNGLLINVLKEEGKALLIAEREIIKDIIEKFAAKAKDKGASAMVPKINANTELTHFVDNGFGKGSYWNSKTTLTGEILYYK